MVPAVIKVRKRERVHFHATNVSAFTRGVLSMQGVHTSVIFSVFLCIAAANALAADISGKVLNGLRVLAPEEVASQVLTVYRGDYVVFPVVDGESTALLVPGLNILHVFPAEKGEKNYVKFKHTGSYAFAYGESKGEIRVIEYQQASYRAVGAEEAKEILANISPLLLDVRTPEEYARDGFIAGATLLPVQVLQREYTRLLDYQEQPVLIYCATGNRSTVAAKILIDRGFKHIYNVRYGLVEWKARGFPVKYITAE